MTIHLQSSSKPANARHAVILCCDEGYLPFAALGIETLRRNSPDRDFDICLVSQAPLTLPDSLSHWDLRLCVMDVGDAFDGLRTSERFSVAAYLRLALPAAFVADYDRILYLDCDVFAVGPAVGDIFELDLHGAPVGAVSDNVKWKRPGKPTPDQAALEINGPYFNSGVLLIDCQRFLDVDVLGRCLALAQTHAEDKIYFDQTLLNLALTNEWAQLHPAWNWQWSVVRAMFEVLIEVQLVHFVSEAKPWSDSRGRLPVRYRAFAERFLGQHFPHVDVPNTPRPMPVKRLIAQLFRHMGKAPQMAKVMDDAGTDIRRVKAPGA